MEILTQNASTFVLDLVCQDLNILAACSITDYTKYCGNNTKMVSYMWVNLYNKLKKFKKIKFLRF